MAKTSVTSTTFQFKISDVSKLTRCWTPKFYIHDVPWKVEVENVENQTRKSLAYYLHQVKENPSAHWSCSAMSLAKLLPVNDDQPALEHFTEPFIFDCSAANFGKTNLIQWERLLNVENGYVKDDTIELEFKIDVEDPNKVNKSKMTVEYIEGNCERGFQTTLRLTVTNIANVHGVRSRQFNLCLTVFKDQKSKLGAYLFRSGGSNDVPCKMTATAKLLSSTKGELSIAKTQSIKLKMWGVLVINNLVLWQELMNPENGFVKQNYIIMEVKVQIDNPKRDAPNDAMVASAKRQKLECAVCFEDFHGQNISTTPCGHLFCSECIKNAIKHRQICPTCKTPVRSIAIRRVYLPM